MITMAAAVPPGPAQTTIIAVSSAVITLIGAYLVYRSAQRANRINDRQSLSQAQLAWTQQAMTEATAAKAEARAATTSAIEAERAARAAGSAASAATERAEAAEARLIHVSDLTEKLIDWIARVVRKAHAEGISDNATPAVSELLRVINGGPPEISTTRLRERGE
jgi:type II secretory pathway component PulM